MKALNLTNEKRSHMLARLARRTHSTAAGDIRRVDPHTLEVELNQIFSIEDAKTTLMKPVSGESVTTNRPVPPELLRALKPSTIQMESVDPLPCLSSSLLIPISKDETQKLTQMQLEDASKSTLEFATSIDPAGRIQLPPNVLFDSRVRPGRSVNIIIEFSE